MYGVAGAKSLKMTKSQSEALEKKLEDNVISGLIESKNRFHQCYSVWGGSSSLINAALVKFFLHKFVSDLVNVFQKSSKMKNS